MSAKNVQVFNMMVKALIVQSFMPLIFSFPGMILYMLLQFISLRWVAAEYLGSAISAFVIVVDPCITLYYVLPYRRYLLRRFGFVNEAASKTTVSVVIQTPRSVMKSNQQLE
ncbi:unnamed protein product [Cylicocyclus nassatus]|uniref:G protein-coupled receptor n=1 Tax=Cylicocyclus nassatus TaxID=53992 RepID=A0AA36M6C2_CYLNA|nr:unnamed protein product [Cylicocyclus nassatus]